jgi:hypothetical protein
MLNREQLEQIAAMLRIPADALSAAISSKEETLLDIQEGLTVLNEDELVKLKNAEYASGKSKGVEMEVKNLKEKFGFDFAGKSIEALLEAAQKKAAEDAGAAPADTIQQLNTELETLRTEKQNLQTELEIRERDMQRAVSERELYREVPTLGEGATAIDKIINLMKLDGYDFKTEEGKLMTYCKGEVVNNEETTVKDVVTAYARQHKLMPEQTIMPIGRGGGDGRIPMHVFTRFSEVEQHFRDNGKSTNGEEFLNRIKELKHANPDFDMVG